MHGAELGQVDSSFGDGPVHDCLLHFFQNKLHSMHAQDGTVQGALMLPSGDPLHAWRLRLHGSVVACSEGLASRAACGGMGLVSHAPSMT